MISNNGKDRVPVTDAMLETIRAERDRTGVGPAALLASCEDAPKGLTVATINNWLSGVGRTADPAHLDYILEHWRALPDAEGARRLRKGFVEITDEMRAQMRAHKERTGLAPTALLRGAENVPRGLNAGLVSRWMTGQHVMARPAHIEFIMKAWEARPDRRS